MNEELVRVERAMQSTDLRKGEEIRGHWTSEVSAPFEVRDVSLRLGEFQLGPVTFQGQSPHITAVLGPNGSGKTTLLRVVSGELKPEDGFVSLGGKPVQAMKHRERARQISLVAQESALHFPMTVLEYCLLARHPFQDGLRLASKEDLEIVRWALDLTQASAFEHRWMNELSGGERQRVILARALAQTPRLLLLDEPTLNLDVAFQMRLLELVERVANECAMAVLMVTHELNLAAEFAHDVLMIRKGKPLVFGRPGEVMTKELLQELFDFDLVTDKNPVTGAPRVTLVRGTPPSSGSAR